MIRMFSLLQSAVVAQRLWRGHAARMEAATRRHVIVRLQVYLSRRHHTM